MHTQNPGARPPTAARTLVASSLKMVLSMAHDSSSLRDVRYIAHTSCVIGREGPDGKMLEGIKTHFWTASC